MQPIPLPSLSRPARREHAAVAAAGTGVICHFVQVNLDRNCPGFLAASMSPPGGPVARSPGAHAQQGLDDLVCGGRGRCSAPPVTDPRTGPARCADRLRRLVCRTRTSGSQLIAHRHDRHHGTGPSAQLASPTDPSRKVCAARPQASEPLPTPSWPLFHRSRYTRRSAVESSGSPLMTWTVVSHSR